MSDFHEALARVARAQPRLDIGPVQICALVAMRLMTRSQTLAELGEERLSDLFVHAVEVVEGGSRLPRKKATHGLELLREQGLLSRVDGAGVVRAGAYSLTRLGVAIADTWIEDEALTRQSLVLLTTALRSKLAEVLDEAQRASAPEHWEAIREELRVTVATLVEGIDQRRRGLDQQQAELQAEVSELLGEGWAQAVETCERLLEEMTTTLAELRDVLLGETGDLLNLLADIESTASEAEADASADAAREAQLRVDGIAAWGRSRHEAWSEYFGMVQRFIRDHVRMDPDRAVSCRLQDTLAAWPDEPWTLDVVAPAPYKHLRHPEVARPRVRVARAARDREPPLEEIDSRDREAELAELVLAWLRAHPRTTLSEALRALLPERQRFLFAGRIARHLALLGVVDADAERPWVPVDDALEVEQWRIRLAEGE